jgi:hypothetical protein
MEQKGFHRKLTAILSADVAGYSRLMQDDEAATVKTLEAYKHIISDLVKRRIKGVQPHPALCIHQALCRPSRHAQRPAHSTMASGIIGIKGQSLLHPAPPGPGPPARHQCLKALCRATSPVGRFLPPVPATRAPRIAAQQPQHHFLFSGYAPSLPWGQPPSRRTTRRGNSGRPTASLHCPALYFQVPLLFSHSAVLLGHGPLSQIRVQENRGRLT